MLIIKSMGNASNIINSVFTIFFIPPPALNDNLQGFTPVIDENTGKITGYKTAVGGADTVFPFSSVDISLENITTTTYDKNNVNLDGLKGKYAIVAMYSSGSSTATYAIITHAEGCEYKRLYHTTISDSRYHHFGVYLLHITEDACNIQGHTVKAVTIL